MSPNASDIDNSDSTLGNVLSQSQTRPGRIGRRVVLGVLAAFCVLALLQLFGRTTSVNAQALGFEVAVDYAPAGRAGMPTEVIVRVSAERPIDKPIVISLSQTYLGPFSVDNISPEAVNESYRDGMLELNYDPPNDKEFTVHLRGTWESGNSMSADGHLQITVGGQIVAEFPLHSWLVL